MKNIIKSLTDFGLTQKEASLYFTLLSSGRSSVKKIAARSDIKRPNAYVILEELRKKGFTLKIPFSNKIQYEAKSPEEVRNIIKSKFDNFNDLYPLLERTQKKEDTFDTFYYEGLAGIEDALLYKIESLKDKKITGFFSKGNNLGDDIFLAVDKYSHKLLKNNIKIVGITPDHPSIRDHMPRYSKIYENIKLIPPETYDSEISIEACGEFVRIIDFQEMKVVIIESKKLSSALESIYKLSVSGLDK